MGTQYCTAALENSLTVPQNIKHGVSRVILLLGYTQEKWKPTFIQNLVYEHI